LLGTTFDKKNLNIKVLYEFPESSLRMDSIPDNQILKLTEHMIEAMYYLHKRKLIHGDV